MKSRKRGRGQRTCMSCNIGMGKRKTANNKVLEKKL